MTYSNLTHIRTLSALLFFVLVIDSYAQEFTWTPQNSGTHQWLNDIYFADRLNGWAVGTNGAIVATTDGGLNWSLQTSGTDQELRSVFFLSPDSGWVAGGTDGPVILNTVDGGATWSPMAIDLPGITILKKLLFADPLTGYAIDTTDIYQTADGGLTWEQGRYSSLIMDIMQMEDLYVLSGDAAFACGYYRNKTNETMSGIFENLTFLNGQWVSQEIGQISADERLTSIHFTGAWKGFAGSSSGKVYTMEEEVEFFPGSWTLNFESGKGNVYSIAFSTDTHGLFSVSDTGNILRQFVYHTADSGVSWSSIPDTIPDLHKSSLAAPDVNHAWIAGNNGIIYKGERNNPVSVTPQQILELSIRPNPFSSMIVMESPIALRNAFFEIFDCTGKSVRSGPLGTGEASHTLTGLETLDHGIYLLRVRNLYGNLIATRKIVKY